MPCLWIEAKDRKAISTGHYCHVYSTATFPYVLRFHFLCSKHTSQVNFTFCYSTQKSERGVIPFEFGVKKKGKNVI